jgi:hypothetical protein
MDLLIVVTVDVDVVVVGSMELIVNILDLLYYLNYLYWL